jgi:hypothetical protein
MSPVAIDSHHAEGVVYLLSSLETLKAIVTQMARQQAKSRLRVFGKGGEPFLEGEKKRVRLLTRRVHSPSQATCSESRRLRVAKYLATPI